MRSLLVVSVLLALVALTPAPGAPGSASAETISIVASDNAVVFKKDATTDQNEAQTLTVYSNGSEPYSQLTYLRFDVSPLAHLVTIESASLDLYWLSASKNGSVCVVALNDLANGGQTTETSWDSHLTWNTRPDGTGSVLNPKTSGPWASLDFVKGDPPTLVRFDLTSALPELLAGDMNNQLTFIMYATTTNDTKFASLDNGSYAVPTLNVTGAIPEPGTLALLGAAVLGLGFYAWRKRRRGVTG